LTSIIINPINKIGQGIAIKTLNSIIVIIAKSVSPPISNIEMQALINKQVITKINNSMGIWIFEPISNIIKAASRSIIPKSFTIKAIRILMPQ
jgi:hypothetical protein